jgi:hypothetical protein
MSTLPPEFWATVVILLVSFSEAIPTIRLSSNRPSCRKLLQTRHLLYLSLLLFATSAFVTKAIFFSGHLAPTPIRFSLYTTAPLDQQPLLAVAPNLKEVLNPSLSYAALLQDESRPVQYYMSVRIMHVARGTSVYALFRGAGEPCWSKTRYEESKPFAGVPQYSERLPQPFHYHDSDGVYHIAKVAALHIYVQDPLASLDIMCRIDPNPVRTSFSGRYFELLYSSAADVVGPNTQALAEKLSGYNIIPRIHMDLNVLQTGSGGTLHISGGEIDSDIRSLGDVGDVQRTLRETKGGTDGLVDVSWEDAPSRDIKDEVTLLLGALIAIGATVLLEWVRPVIL